MLILLSPAKTLNPTNPEAHSIEELTSPVFLNEVEKLTQALSQWDLTTTMARLKLSENMAKRAMEWHKSWQRQGGHAAGWTFQGDAFKSLDLPSFADEHVWAAQRRLRILNGAYGLLRPLDRYRPVRLEMGLNWCPFEGVKNMTHYWRPKLNAQLALESSEIGTSRILNLASSEYGDVALHGRPMSDVVSCVFLEIKGGKHRSISAYAKAARGAMARFVLTNDIDHPNQLSHFDGLGYAYSGELSSRGKKVFTRTLRP